MGAVGGCVSGKPHTSFNTATPIRRALTSPRVHHARVYTDHMTTCFLFPVPADLDSVDDSGATAWDYARGRQLHYCMLIIASYIRQRARARGEDVDIPTLANMTFAGQCIALFFAF